MLFRSNAAGDTTLGFEIDTITLDTQGLGYRNIPTVNITTSISPTDDPTTPAAVTPVLDEQTGRLSSLTLDNAGAGYEATPTVSIDGGGGQGATITVDVQSLTGSITASGSGYTAGTYNNVPFTTTGNGTSATADITIPGFQGSITSAGSG